MRRESLLLYLVAIRDVIYEKCLIFLNNTDYFVKLIADKIAFAKYSGFMFPFRRSSSNDRSLIKRLINDEKRILRAN